MSKCVIVLEDEPDLADLVRELLEEADYSVIIVDSIERLLTEAARRSPCVALLDSTSPTGFDLWHLGPKLIALGVPPVAFTAHSSAREEFAKDPHGFVGLIAKPFDADEFIDLVNQICWEDYQAVAS